MLEPGGIEAPMEDPEEIEIPEAQREILASNLLGLVSTLRQKDGLISTNPVTYTWDGECVRFSTIKDRVKVRNLLANPIITFCVVDQKDFTRYVELRGRASIQEDPDRSFLRDHFRANGHPDPPDDLDPPGTERVVVRIHPIQSSSPLLYGGRFAGDGSPGR
jgi:PPOX class probable F420-dependent enzyme